jgi:hypothetical protein
MQVVPIYQLVFALEQEDQEQADQIISKAGLWLEISDQLRNITVVDPACGSGSFLVGMLNILDNLQERADLQLGIKPEDSFTRKKRIIGQSLYGVDVMEWACHIAELRLWLALIIEAEFTREELHVRNEPLLPHFTFKIRCGDSLVQEVAGVDFSFSRHQRHISSEAGSLISTLKREKIKFYNCEPTCKYKSTEALLNEEKRVFKEILDVRKQEIDNKIITIRRKNEGSQEKRIGLFDGAIEQQPHQMDLNTAERERQLALLSQERIQIENWVVAIQSAPHAPFVWDLAFVEVFADGNNGFDIVLGNPPYVRQESITAPVIHGVQINEEKKEYKSKLALAAYRSFPHFFGYKPGSNLVAHKIDAKSDLYIYFYLRGLSLLNDKGSFCFITSNSWLDVGYGADLQEFLLRHSHVRMILDNEMKRSFKEADVNTIITLFSAPDDSKDWGVEKVARFVMFRVPFENIVSAVIFEEIEEVTKRKVTDEYRVFPIIQGKLLEDGFEIPKEDEPDKPSGPLIKTTRYVGNKWGGKYLRAPDIYWTILLKGSSYIRQLSELFDGERYLNTGGADGFFIINNTTKASGDRLKIYNDNVTREKGEPFEGEIEQKYLVPLIKDYTKTDKRLEISGHDAYCLVVGDNPSTKVKEYIMWGEKQGYHRRSVTKTQNPWYRPTRQMLSAAKILVPRSFSDSYAMYYNPRNYLSLRFYRLHPKGNDEVVQVAYLNTTLVALIIETLGNKSLGLGVLDFFMADFLSLRIPVILNQDLKIAFNKLKQSAVLPVKEEYGFEDGQSSYHPRPERTDLDNIVFDILKLTRGERNGVYEAIISLVEMRQIKASSISSRQLGKRIDAFSKTQGIWSTLPKSSQEEPED